jgi:hypothetical protein
MILRSTRASKAILNCAWSHVFLRNRTSKIGIIKSTCAKVAEILGAESCHRIEHKRQTAVTMTMKFNHFRYRSMIL